jgi:hypothetical protein
MKVMRWMPVNLDVSWDRAAVMSHACGALLAQVADTLGFTRARSLRLSGLHWGHRKHEARRERRRGSG